MIVDVWISVLILVILVVVWGVSEVMLAKCTKNSKQGATIWLVINIILPVVGYILYKLSHIKEEKSQN